MEPELKVYLDRVQGGRIEVIKETLSSAFIDVDEPDLTFNDPVTIKGKAYLANDHLVIYLVIETTALISCAICNHPVHIIIKIAEFYHTEELIEIKGKIYNYADPLREAILLEVPSYGECQGGCPERKQLEKYKSSKRTDETIRFPFADLK